MTQYKKYLENNYTKATVETYFKGITIFNDFLDDREIQIYYQLSITVIKL